jgi:hypothetical protein
MKMKKQYETIICAAIALVFLVLPLRLLAGLCFNYWSELLSAQLLQIAGVLGLISLLLYLIEVYQENHGHFFIKVKEYLKKRPWLIFFLLFILWMGFSFLANGCYKDSSSITYVLYGRLGRNEGIFLRTMEIVLMVMVMKIISSEKKTFLLRLLMGASLLVALPVLAQGFPVIAKVTGLSSNQGFQLMSEFGRGCSVLANSNHYGYYLCIVILLSAGMFITEEKTGWQLYALVVFLANTLTLPINNTFGAWLAAALAILFMTVIYTLYYRHADRQMEIFQSRYQYFKIVAVVVLFFCVSSLYSPVDGSMFEQLGKFLHDIVAVSEDSSSDEALNAGTGRWRIWGYCVEFIQQKPIFGWCEDGLVGCFAEKGMIERDRPACEYLQYAAFYGIPALIYYMAAILLIAMDRLKKIYHLSPLILVSAGAVVAYLISACFGNTTNYVTMHFFLLLGMMTGDINTNKNDGNTSIIKRKA